MDSSRLEHRFFERYLDIDFDNLYEFLLEKEQQILNGEFPGMSKDFVGSFIQEKVSISQKLLGYYNIFQLNHPAFHELYCAVRDMAKEACEYYGYDFKQQKYYIQGWFNIEESENLGIDRKSDEEIIAGLHEHSGGHGMPDLHGYFCVFAEPSLTHYQINGETLFDNVNKNGRAILSETGHPHSRGVWNNTEKRRITIAYDTRSFNDILDRDNVSQHWIPLG